MNRKVKIEIAIDPILYDELQRILKSDCCQNRGFNMTESDLIEEMIANFKKEVEE